MSRESDWAVFEKACEITASAVRGTMTGTDGQDASFVADVFPRCMRPCDRRPTRCPTRTRRPASDLRSTRESAQPLGVTSRIDTMPTTFPDSTTGRWRNPNANIDSSAS